MSNLSPEELKRASQAMDEMLDNDKLEAYFEDDEKLEAARLDMLKNLDKYEQAMPGFRAQAEAIASDPVLWKESMTKARMQMKELKKQRDAMRAAQQQQQGKKPSPQQPDTK